MCYQKLMLKSLMRGNLTNEPTKQVSIHSTESHFQVQQQWYPVQLAEEES